MAGSVVVEDLSLGPRHFAMRTFFPDGAAWGTVLDLTAEWADR